MKPAEARSFVDRCQVEKRRFLEVLKDGRRAQQRLLEEIVTKNRDTAFGVEHDFGGVSTIRDLRARVPIRSYEGLAPWIDRVIAGENRVLTKAPPSLVLTTTGSTGKPKAFPVTTAYLATTMRNTLVFWDSWVRRHPELLERDDAIVALHLMPRPHSEWTTAGIPIHRLSLMASTVKSALPFTEAPWYPPPNDVDLADMNYYLARSALASDLRAVIALHVSRLQGFARVFREESERLLGELESGAVAGRPGVHRPNPSRALSLRSRMGSGSLLPRHVWPRLGFVTGWLGGAFSNYRSEIDDAFGAAVYPYPSTSTEGSHVTLPIDHVADGPLSVHANLYEFRPAEEGASDASLTFEDLELDHAYEMILTTRDGLYRYSCGDIFRVVGFVAGVPRMEFVARRGTSSLAGEKLSDQQALAALTKAVSSARFQVFGATCCATWTQPPRYVCLLEVAETLSDATRAEIATLIDRELSEQNSRYLWLRTLGSLGALEVRAVRRGAFARYQDRMIRRGAPAGQTKDRPLQEDPSVLAAYEEIDRELARGSPRRDT